MPYPDLSDLPAAVRRLPPHAQHIFRAAFNSAWQSYAGYEPHAREEIAFRVAWAAVKRRYRKIGDVWVARDALRIDRLA
jgi:cation transport regulator